MKVEQHDATDEKHILTGMIVSDLVCGRISDKWVPEGLFKVRWTNLVAGWCVQYFAKYSKAPRGDIEGLFNSWVATTTDEATADLVDRFLDDLSGDYEAEEQDTNPVYLVDVAGQYFNAVALERMAETVAGHIKAGQLDKALAAATEWDRVEMGSGSGIDVMQDQAAIEAAFDDSTEALITYPGALGEFFGTQLARDEFVAFVAATGRGKTWWLIDVAWMGVRQGKRVAFFEVGDMSQNQIMRRFMCRATGNPIKAPFNVDIPVDMYRDRDQSMATVVTETKRFPGPLNGAKAWENCKQRARRHKKPLLRLSCHPNSSINVAGIVSTLNTWERSGWIPDVVVIDYADILAAPAGYPAGDREAINQTWKELRSLSQQKHCLVLTATQADANSYDRETISRSNFSDDRRKNDHVTGMLGINATEPETAAGIFRLNWTKRREDSFMSSKCVHVAGNLNCGRPHIKSTF